MVRVPREVFDDIVQQVLDGLPPPFDQIIERVPVIVEDHPSAAVYREVEGAEELLGLFTGPPVAEWDASEGHPEPTLIHVYQRNLEAVCLTREELAEQVRVTILHELGHCLGFDEDGLERLGLD